MKLYTYHTEALINLEKVAFAEVRGAYLHVFVSGRADPIVVTGEVAKTLASRLNELSEGAAFARDVSFEKSR